MARTFIGLVLVLLVAGCAYHSRTSARFVTGKANYLTKTPSGLVVSVLNYCAKGQTCRQPTVKATWSDQGEINEVVIGYGPDDVRD